MHKVRSTLTVLAAGAGMALAMAPPASATTYGFHWQSDTVYVIDSTEQGGNTAKAVKAWDAQQPYLNFKSVNSCPAGATCIDFDRHGGDGIWVAHAHMNQGKSCTVSWNDAYSKKRMDNKTWQNAAMHEIGHCVGLAHPAIEAEGGVVTGYCDPREAASIMRRSLSCTSQTLTEDDLADLSTLYAGVYSKGTGAGSGGNNGNGNNGNGNNKGPDHPSNSKGPGNKP